MSFIIDAKEAAQSVKHESEDYKRAFCDGLWYAQQKITPLFVEFAEWLVGEHTHLIHSYRDMDNSLVWYDWRTEGHEQLTTKEVFVLWCEERNKK